MSLMSALYAGSSINEVKASALFREIPPLSIRPSIHTLGQDREDRLRAVFTGRDRIDKFLKLISINQAHVI